MQSSFSSGTGTSTPRLPHLPYRLAKELPYELREHCIIYFEEALYSQALNLLLLLTSSGSSTSRPKPAFIPPAQHLALISTLAIHPSFTTRAKSPDKLDAANLAIKYLRLLHKTVGPLNIRANDAFAFASPATSTRRGGASRRRAGGAESPEKEQEAADSIDTELANVGSLWTCADDFWHVVGWGFNCSVAHAKRWERWQLWLDYMVGFLEDDWYDRSGDDREESLIIKYLNPGDRVSVGEKRIVRAIFADGSSRSLAEFKEIWKNETQERKVVDEAAMLKKATVKVNIEEDIYGDYMQSSSDELDAGIPADEIETPRSPQDSTTASIDGSLSLGGPSAIQLRLRLLALLATVAIDLPNKFTSLRTLYDIYLTHIRPYPLPTFSLLISPPSLHYFSFSSASALVQYIVASLISSSALIPKKDDLTQELLEKYFLPWPANTTSISDNAKLGACVETLLRMLYTSGGLVWTDSCHECLEEGIRAREGKGTKERKRKGEAAGGNEGDRAWLRDNGTRMRVLLDGTMSWPQKRDGNGPL